MEALRHLLIDWLVTIGWGVAGALAMGLGLAVSVTIFSLLTPKINEVEELKKGNIGVAIVLSAVILATAVVVAVTLLPERAV